MVDQPYLCWFGKVRQVRSNWWYRENHADDEKHRSKNQKNLRIFVEKSWIATYQDIDAPEWKKMLFCELVPGIFKARSHLQFSRFAKTSSCNIANDLRTIIWHTSNLQWIYTSFISDHFKSIIYSEVSFTVKCFFNIQIQYDAVFFNSDFSYLMLVTVLGHFFRYGRVNLPFLFYDVFSFLNLLRGIWHLSCTIAVEWHIGPVRHRKIYLLTRCYNLGQHEMMP